MIVSNPSSVLLPLKGLNLPAALTAHHQLDARPVRNVVLYTSMTMLLTLLELRLFLMNRIVMFTVKPIYSCFVTLL